ncbi:MAG TPA: hypothetical protein VMX55_06450 [candidate division Zixibacteria bacterium]|nr:hypothetical protein [candidate division Zixibacteria bacterium]
MIDEKSIEKIISLLNDESAMKRRKGVKLACANINEELLEKLILILQIDEKESVRKITLMNLISLKIQNKNIEQEILNILSNSSINEPNPLLRKIAKKGIEKRKNKTENPT